MTDGSTRRGGRVLTLLSLVVVLVGVALVAVGLSGQDRAPSAPRSVGTIEPPLDPTTSPVPSGSPAAPEADAPTGSPRQQAKQQPRDEQPLGLSRPVSLRIPSLDIATEVNPIGKNPDGTLAVPQPGPRLDEAAWFDQSPSPGQPGPSIIEGHVDTESGPSVFFDLADIEPGATIEVTRKDGTVATFTVDGVRTFAKSAFPTELVYGGKDLTTPQLRLITCADFDPTTRHHVGNAIVFAHLTDVRTA